MTFIDILIIIGVLMIATFIVELILMKIYNIPIRKERFINDKHKKRYKKFILIFASVLFVFFALYILGIIVLFIPLTIIIWYPIASSLVDFSMEWKYARESRRFIISISNIVVYVVFLVVLFFTDFFGLMA